MVTMCLRGTSLSLTSNANVCVLVPPGVCPERGGGVRRCRPHRLLPRGGAIGGEVEQGGGGGEP